MSRFYSRLDKTFPSELAKIEACTCPGRKRGFLFVSLSLFLEPLVFSPLCRARGFPFVSSKCEHFTVFPIFLVLRSDRFSSRSLAPFPRPFFPHPSFLPLLPPHPSSSTRMIPFSFSRPLSPVCARAPLVSLARPSRPSPFTPSLRGCFFAVVHAITLFPSGRGENVVSHLMPAGHRASRIKGRIFFMQSHGHHDEATILEIYRGQLNYYEVFETTVQSKFCQEWY